MNKIPSATAGIDHTHEPTKRDIALCALSIAAGYSAAKIHEEGGNNRGDQVEFFQHVMHGAPGDPWCADFVCTCLVKATARCYGLPEDREHLEGYLPHASGILVPLSGSCVELAHAAKVKQMLRPATYSPVPGDLVLFDFARLGAAHHVGFVRNIGYGYGNKIATVEGNTGAGPGPHQGDGDGVYERLRDRAFVYGFVSFS